MRRLPATAALALALLVPGARDAAADAKRDVRIESEPPGADVYLNSKDEGSVCKTPCTVKAPVGETILILEIENHVPLIENLVVPKRGKAPTARFKLVRSVGTLVVKGPAGATIRVGDTDRGKAPAKLEVDAGPQTVTLILNGKQVFQDLVEVEVNEEVVVKGPEVAAAPKPDPPDPDPDPPDGPDGPTGPTTGGGTGITDQGEPRPPRAKIAALSALINVGFRRFRYENVDMASMATLRKEDEGGQLIAGPQLELWPGVIAGVRALRGLALVGRIQFPLNKQPVTGPGLNGTTTTFWQSLEISARQRWTFSGKGSVEVGAGFVRDQHQFNTNDLGNLQLVPDADYRSIRIGVRGALLLGTLEPYLAAENRIVLSGGKVISDRFSLGTSASGLRGALGVAKTFGAFIARVEGSFTRYSWTFKYDTMDMFKADGATDSIMSISAGFGYAY